IRHADRRAPRRRGGAAERARALLRWHVADAAFAGYGRQALGALAPGVEEPGGVGRTRSGRPRVPRQGQDRRQSHARSRRLGRAPLVGGHRRVLPVPPRPPGDRMNTNDRKLGALSALIGGLGRALQWRLLVLWAVGLLLPTVVAVLPLSMALSER